VKLIPEARRLWHKLWSVRLSLISAVLATSQTCIDYYTEGQPRLIIIGTALISIGSALSRVIAQDELHGTKH